MFQQNSGLKQVVNRDAKNDKSNSIHKDLVLTVSLQAQVDGLKAELNSLNQANQELTNKNLDNQKMISRLRQKCSHYKAKLSACKR
jgi:predicted RNase H-like nuclease (RuvC/YqgF family)